MNEPLLVKKASGEKQEFSEEKLRRSLIRSGASEDLIQMVLNQIREQLYDGISTQEIYRKAFGLLHKKIKSLAARYSLKKAIMELGPTGFPFEKLVGEILKTSGYRVQTGITKQGKCVKHEVDVWAENEHGVVIIECKYHNTPGTLSPVQVPLYVNSRFKDIETVWADEPGNNNKLFNGWIVTNTRFSTDAEDYGHCAGLKLIGWDYPQKDNLKELIERTSLFPITAITGLSKKQKETLLDQDIIICKQLQQKRGILSGFGLTDRKLREVLLELDELCMASGPSY